MENKKKNSKHKTAQFIHIYLSMKSSIEQTTTPTTTKVGEGRIRQKMKKFMFSYAMCSLGVGGKLYARRQFSFHILFVVVVFH